MKLKSFALIQKQTLFALSLDRDIKTRELYLAGERGDYWQASAFEYEN